MKTKHTYLSDLHSDHKMWTHRLGFYKEEVDMFESYLGEVSVKNTSRDCLAEVEQFQNQFIRQKEVVDELVHDIKLKEESLIQYAKDHPVAIDHVYFKPEPALTARFQTFEKIYGEMKGDYRKFLAKWM